MTYSQMFKEDNEAIRERYELAMERIALMEQEKTVGERFLPYFQRVSAFVIMVKNVVSMVEEGRIQKLSLKEQASLNRALFEDITGDNYYYSFTNPAYACERFGDKFGKLLSFLFTELRGIIIYAYESRLYELTIYLELLIEIYIYFEEEDE